MHDVALIDPPHPGASIQWGEDGGVVEIGSCRVDQRLILAGLRLVLSDQGFLRVGLLGGRKVVAHQLLVTHQIDPGVGQQRLILRLLGDGLIEGGLIVAGVDLRQDVALADHLTLGEFHRDQRAVDHGLDGNAIERLHRPQGVQHDRHVAPFGRPDEHRDPLPGDPVARRDIRRRGDAV